MDAAHARLLKEIEAEAQATARSTGISAFDARVMQAMADVPRHEFVSAGAQPSAYLDSALPIGHGQTISQPTIVALMTDVLEISPGARVLEVGGGSGYQAAVLSKLAGIVHTVERIPELAQACRERLRRLGIGNVVVHEGDGSEGLENEAPFDAILVAAAARSIPPELVRQLRNGGRMVLPLGEPGGAQELVLLTKDIHGEVAIHPLLPVRFVPLRTARN